MFSEEGTGDSQPPAQIDLSVKWLKKNGGGGGGAEGEVKQERQVIVSPGVCDLTKQEGEERKEQKRFLFSLQDSVGSLQEERKQTGTVLTQRGRTGPPERMNGHICSYQTYSSAGDTGFQIALINRLLLTPPSSLFVSENTVRQLCYC